MPTIRDIAQRAQVSPATVSRVLNNYPNVHEATRATVLRAAHDLNYTNDSPRSSQRATETVLVLTRDTNMPNGKAAAVGREFERTVWGGVSAYFQEKQIPARLQSTGISGAAAQQYAQDPGVSGLVLLGGVINRDFVARLQSLMVPVVIAGAHLRPMQVNCVMADVFDGMSQVLVHLLEGAGRQRIGFVNGVPTTTTSQMKLDAFHLELCRHDLPFSPDRVAVSDFEAAAGYATTSQLLERHPDLDAIVFADDVIAIGGLKALRETGRRVPDDVAVTGFGDYDLAQFVEPNLTTVHYDMHAIGRIAARRLSMLMTEPDADTWFNLVPPKLVRRQSA
ncbi:MAG: LacI family DNA-binding transcriptional regulator [Chloroflexi bacterium]|nr:LacI family DNA-binding transcriptional regulator [Chloroflexota bacterium]